MRKVINIILLLLSIFSASKSFEIKESSCDGSDALRAFYELPRNNMRLTISIDKYQFLPGMNWKDMEDKPISQLKSEYQKTKNYFKKGVSFREYLKEKTINFYRIMFRVNSDERESSFFDKNKKYTLTDHGGSNTVNFATDIIFISKQATLKISTKKPKEKDLFIKFNLGPLRKTTKFVHPYFYDESSKNKKKIAVLTNRVFEMDSSDSVSYQIFMYVFNKNEKNPISPKNEKKALKIIMESNKGIAEQAFSNTQDVRIVNNLDVNLCPFVRQYVKEVKPNTVEVDLFKAAESLVRNPDEFLTPTLAFRRNVADDSKYGKDSIGKASNSERQKLFDEYFKKFRNSVSEAQNRNLRKAEHSSFLRNINEAFLRLMKDNLKKYRQRNNIKLNFQPDRKYTGKNLIDSLKITFPEDAQF